MEQVASEGQQLFNIYLTCKSLEVELEQLILQGGGSAAMVQSAERFLMARQGKVNGNLKDLHEAPHGSTFIKHNGVLGVAGHFISTIDVDQALYQLLGAPVIRENKTKIPTADTHSNNSG